MVGSDVTLTLFLIVYFSLLLTPINLGLDEVLSGTGTHSSPGFLP